METLVASKLINFKQQRCNRSIDYSWWRNLERWSQKWRGRSSKDIESTKLPAGLFERLIVGRHWRHFMQPFSLLQWKQARMVTQKMTIQPIVKIWRCDRVIIAGLQNGTRLYECILSASPKELMCSKTIFSSQVIQTILNNSKILTHDFVSETQ